MALIWSRFKRIAILNPRNGALSVANACNTLVAASGDAGSAPGATGRSGCTTSQLPFSVNIALPLKSSASSYLPSARQMTTLRPPSGRSRRQNLPSGLPASNIGERCLSSESAEPSCSYGAGAQLVRAMQRPQLPQAVKATVAARTAQHDGDSSGTVSDDCRTLPCSRSTPLLERSQPQYPHPQAATAGKSAKRRAAEALLAARFGAGPLQTTSSSNAIFGTLTATSAPPLLTHAASYSSLHSLGESLPPSAVPSPPHGTDAPPSPSPGVTFSPGADFAAAGAGLGACHAGNGLAGDWEPQEAGEESLAPAGVAITTTARALTTLARLTRQRLGSNDSTTTTTATTTTTTSGVGAAAAVGSRGPQPLLRPVNLQLQPRPARPLPRDQLTPHAAGQHPQQHVLLHPPQQPQQQHQRLQQVHNAPSAKLPRVSLSAVATSSLGGPSGPGSGPTARPVTVVPSCDPDRGCKCKLSTHKAAAAAAGGSAGGAGTGMTTSLSAALEAVFGGDGGSGSSGGSSSSSSQGPAAPAASVQTAPVLAWCGFEVKLPSVNWQAVFDEPPSSLQRLSLARGYEKLLLPEGLVSYVVENPKHVEDALAKLKAGMQDRVIAIDLEWRPETVSGRISPVATIQLSSATVCLILRTSSMGYSLPSAVAAFLTDPSITLLGFAWDSADESKMKSTFGLGRNNFRRFLDLQEVAASLGYHNYGLARLAAQVLGVPLLKSKTVSRSNWAAPQLTNHQLKYASLDVLVAGQLFRALRLWHSSPSPCAACRTPIGEISGVASLRCGSCKFRPFGIMALKAHCLTTGHALLYDTCGSCGRYYKLPVVKPEAEGDEAAANDKAEAAGPVAAQAADVEPGAGETGVASTEAAAPLLPNRKRKVDAT